MEFYVRDNEMRMKCNAVRIWMIVFLSIIFIMNNHEIANAKGESVTFDNVLSFYVDDKGVFEERSDEVISYFPSDGGWLYIEYIIPSSDLPIEMVEGNEITLLEACKTEISLSYDTVYIPRYDVVKTEKTTIFHTQDVSVDEEKGIVVSSDGYLLWTSKGIVAVWFVNFPEFYVTDSFTESVLASLELISGTKSGEGSALKVFSSKELTEVLSKEKRHISMLESMVLMSESIVTPMLTVETTTPQIGGQTTALEKSTKNDLSTMVRIIHSGSVNVRKQSNADSQKVGTAKAGSFYEYIDTSSNGWYKIRLENGEEGWISGKMGEVVEGRNIESAEHQTEKESVTYTYKGPKYEIVDSHDTGIGLMQYWVYTKKLDYSTDEYRDQVKAILTDVARNIDNDKVLIDVVTDKEVAYFESFNTYQQYLDEYGWDYMTDIVLPKEEKHWIASYTGGYDEVQSKRSEEDSAYGIYWFIADQTPRDDTTSEQWRPDMRIKLTNSSSISKPTARPTAKPESKKTDKPTQKNTKEEIDLAASQVIIELVINDVNKILGFDAITSYSIRETGFVYFYLSYDFVRISNSERQVFLDAINKALYTQIYGAGTPYSNYKYYVGDTFIAENKMFDPESVKLK